MRKISNDFVIKQYQSGIKNYVAFTTEVGLWASEKYVFTKYLKQSDHILDLGCGTGRTTHHLFQLGYTAIIGVDLTPEMIIAAKKLNEYYQLAIDFEEGDACALRFSDQQFDVVIFSFNGMMSIPDAAKRKQALAEVRRVLKKQGLFIFTTHDREKDEHFFEFWKAEKIRWEQGQQNPQLYDFGDVISQSKNEERDVFIHIPTQAEIKHFLAAEHFEVLESFYRSDQFEESEQVKAKSGECRFWVARKIED